MREAHCRCGSVTARAEGNPVRVSICHCDACKRRTGSAFSHNSTWPDDAVEVEGETRRWTRIAESGGEVSYDFCPTCGSTIAYRLDARPGMVTIAVGAFADPAFPVPHAEIYAEQAPAWLGRLLDEAAQE
ncbi:MAG: GFA family protein [Sphingomonas sp.]|uniref:GFA family protein n=1 Tax=Sphingomonas sp. TaxID=28214 RepID=UPI00184AB0F6|nr:GFA family protein [Sphingomonas sp.]MBA3668391.1 GFA family protein [Sphingomonas sp.]